MSHLSPLIATNIDEYLLQHERKELLRFITCGSVDDGKSTLIGRLFYESKMIYEDQLAAILKDSSRYGTTGEELDLALLPMGSRMSDSRELRLMSPTVTSLQTSENLLSQIRPVTSSTHATWQRGLPLPIWRSF